MSDPVQQYKLVTACGKEIFIEEYELNCIEDIGPDHCDGVDGCWWSEFEWFHRPDGDGSAYCEYGETIFDSEQEALDDVLSRFDVVKRYKNVTRPSWEQFTGNDLRWPNWVEQKGEIQNV